MFIISHRDHLTNQSSESSKIQSYQNQNHHHIKLTIVIVVIVFIIIIHRVFIIIILFVIIVIITITTTTTVTNSLSRPSCPHDFHMPHCDISSFQSCETKTHCFGVSVSQIKHPNPHYHDDQIQRSTIEDPPWYHDMIS